MRKVIWLLAIVCVTACSDDEDTQPPLSNPNTRVDRDADHEPDMAGDVANDVSDASGDLGEDQPEQELRIRPAPTLRINETVQLGAVVITVDDSGDEEDVTADTTWSIEDSSIAEIDESGTLTGLREGVSVVRATFEPFITEAPVRVFANFGTVSAGSRHACATTAGGSVACWGTSQTGAHAASPGSTLSTPRISITDLNAREVSAGDDHTCARTATGEVWCWGDAQFSQLGDSTESASSVPVQVAIEPIDQIDAGKHFTCARTQPDPLAPDPLGSVYCWGRNDRFQLGNAVDDVSATPVLIPETQDQTLDVFVGDAHACALLGFGGDRLICWGDNSADQLSDTAMGERTALPVVVTEINQGAVAAGGTMTCWTPFEEATRCVGQTSVSLGDGATQASSTGVEIQTGQSVGRLVLGRDHHCFGSVGPTRCWGLNSDGQLGLGTLDDATIPEPVAGTPVFRDLAIGDRFTCGVSQRGGVLCWGANEASQLGDSTTRSRDVPTRTSLPTFAN